MSTASEITRKAKSNLAFALHILPPDRRQDMVIFYAFCRTMDDLADDVGIAPERRRRLLDSWKHGLTHGFPNPDHFQKEVLSLRDRREIPNDLLLAIIDGCCMDLEPQRFETWEDLSGYIWKVACAVGLVSIRIFGCQDPASEKYAVALGHALQLTNILRDIEEDYANGQRIYLPLTELSRFSYTEEDLRNSVRDERFLAMMTFESERAEHYFRDAENLIPVIDRAALVPARIMGDIYQLLLEKMRDDYFQVFSKRYRISKVHKLAILTQHLIARSKGIE